MASHQDDFRRRGYRKVKDIYEEIKSKLGIDFVPNLYKVMASNPITWKRIGIKPKQS